MSLTAVVLTVAVTTQVRSKPRELRIHLGMVLQASAHHGEVELFDDGHHGRARATEVTNNTLVKRTAALSYIVRRLIGR